MSRNKLVLTIIVIILAMLLILTNIKAYTSSSSSYNNYLDVSSGGGNFSSTSYNSIITMSPITGLTNSTAYNNYLGFGYAFFWDVPDTIPPSIQLNSPVDNFNTSQSSANFNWTATDNLDTSLSCNLTINNLVNKTAIASISGSPTNISVSGFNDGTYKWNVTCIDDSNNTNISSTRTFTVDTTPPVVILGATVANWKRSGNTTINLTMVDNTIAYLSEIFYESNRDLVYIAVGPQLLAYNSTNNTLTNLSSNLTKAGINAFAYDSKRDILFFGGEKGLFGFYNSSTNLSTNLTNTDSNNWIGANAINAIVYDTDTDVVYLVGDSGLFGVYNASTNVTSALNNTDPENWIGSSILYDIAYASTYKLIYIVGANGVFGVYNASTNVTSALNGTDPDNWFGTGNIYSVVYDPNDKLVYIGGEISFNSAGNKKFGYYNISTNITTKLNGTDLNWMNPQEFWSTTLDELVYDSDRKLIYISGSNSANTLFGVYNHSSNLSVNLRFTSEDNWFSSSPLIYGLTYNSRDKRVYLGGRDSVAAKNRLGAYNASIDPSIFPFTWGANATNGTWHKNGNITLTYSAIDDRGLSACIVYGTFNGSWMANKTFRNILSDTIINFSINLTNGTYLWNVWCNDTLGNYAFNSTNYTFYVDTIKPTITLNAPINNFNTTSNSIIFNWTASDNLDLGLTCNITLDGKVNVSGIESLNGTPTNITIIGLNDSTHFWNVTCIDNATNSNTSITFKFTVDASPPTFQFNSTNATTIRRFDWVRFNVTCKDTIGLSGFIFSHNNSRQWKNESYVPFGGTQNQSNFTLQINLTRADTLGWFFICNDTFGNLGYMSALTNGINNSAPLRVNLSFPLPNSSFTNRTPNFNWSAAYDADGDNISYNLTITRVSCGDISNDCFTDLIKISQINSTNHTITTDLDVDAIYNWTVSAFDGLNYSDWSFIQNFTVVSLLSMKLTVSAVNFGSLNVGDSANTTTDNPQPIVVENDGNVRINITVYANQSLWIRNYAGLDTLYFQMKAGNTSELGAFNASASLFDWINVSSSPMNVFKSLHYNDSKDTGEIDLLIRVPPDEDSGSKITGLVIQGAQTTP